MAEHAAKTGLALSLPDGIYNTLRRIVELVLPGIGAFYAALSQIWGDDIFPAPHKVVATFAALAVLGGLALSASRKAYEGSGDAPPGGYDGKVVEDINEDGKAVLRLQLDTSAAEDLLNKKQLVFKGYDPSA
jgi:hypothetical protein